jgi:hypothetical protein
MAAAARFGGVRSRAGDNADDFDFRCAKRQRNSLERHRFGLSELSSRSSPPPIVSGANSSGGPRAAEGTLDSRFRGNKRLLLR